MKPHRFGKRGPKTFLIDEEGQVYKKCSKCDQILLLTEQNFYKQNTTTSGFRSQCKKCCDAFQMNRYYNEPGFKERLDHDSEKWRRNNLEKVRQWNKQRYHKDIDASRARTRQAVKEYRDRCTPGVYGIFNKQKKIVYVGESRQIEMRWTQHRSALSTGVKCNQTLLEDWRLGGEDSFEFRILYEMKHSTKDERLLKEEQTILEYEKRGYKVYNKRKKCTKII
jgi:hypothetical protein